MQIKSLEELIQELEQEMLNLGYSKNSIYQYRDCCCRLKAYAEENNENHFSERLGIDFVEKSFNVSEKDSDKIPTQAYVRTLRFIRMIGDFQLHHTILRRHIKQKKLLKNPYFISIHKRFDSYCIEKSFSFGTIQNHLNQTAQFFDYLISQRINSCQEICLTNINSYIKTLVGYDYKTVKQHLYSLRTLFRFLHTETEIENDFSLQIPMVQVRKQTKIPSVWELEDLKKLIAIIDRGSPVGKRDYAIILLACRLGLRCTDIKKLKMDNFCWESKKIVLVQSKTKATLSLPITQEVGWAVIDYLKYGRPKVDSSFVFLRHNAPYLPYAERSNFNQIITKYMKIAHISKQGKKTGLHSLRHTLASMLLENDTSLFTIADILGHIDIESTAAYLKVDVKRLKECPLDLLEDML